MATKTLRNRLAKRTKVTFDRPLVESLDHDEIEDLVADFVANPENSRSLGAQFITAMESIYGQPLIIMDTERKNYEAKLMVTQIEDVIGGKCRVRDGVLEVGGRRRKETLYVYWLREITEEDVEPRDPFGPHDQACDKGFARYYDVELYGEDGQPMVKLDVQATIALAWSVGEFPNKTLEALVVEKVANGSVKEPDDLRNFIPKALVEYHKIKRMRDRKRAQEELDNLLKVKKEAGRHEPDPFPESRRARLTV